MANFDFLKPFIDVKEENSNQKHKLLSVENEKLNKALVKLGNIPIELLDFYKQVGYGFFHRDSINSIDRLMSPLQLADLNLREDFYATDPNLELYKADFYKDKLVFFEVNEGVYLLIKECDDNGKNAIYYFEERISNSLEEFIIRFDKEGHYFEK